MKATDKTIWRKGYGRSRKYWGANLNGKTTLLHRFVYEAAHGLIPSGHEIDHIDQNPDNNEIDNLRAVTRSFNHANKGAQKNGRSGFKGVHWYGAYGKWMAKIKKDGKHIFLGYHADTRNAATAVNRAYEIYFPGVSAPNKL